MTKQSIGEVLLEAKIVDSRPSTDTLQVWYGGHGIHVFTVYDDGLEETDYYMFGDVNKAVTETEVRRAMRKFWK